jgi:hypothetical protein
MPHSASRPESRPQPLHCAYTTELCPPLRCAHHCPMPPLRDVHNCALPPLRDVSHSDVRITGLCPPLQCVSSLRGIHHFAVPTTALCRPPMLLLCPPLLLIQHYAYHCIIYQSLLVDRTFVELLPGAVVFSNNFLRLNCHFMRERA